MCVNKIFYRFGNQNKHALLSVTHNSKKSLENVEFLLNNNNFNTFFIELNFANAYFIMKNKFFHSEFYPILKKFLDDQTNQTYLSFNNKNKVKLLDISIEAEVNVFSKVKRNFKCSNTYNFFEEFINYKIAKNVFFKLWNFGVFKVNHNIFDFNEAVQKMDFYKSHILFREYMFLYK